MDGSSSIFKGVIRGTMIELEQSPNLPNGQTVTVVLKPTNGGVGLAPGEGIRRSAGAWADDAEPLEEYLELARRLRSENRQELAP